MAKASLHRQGASAIWLMGPALALMAVFIIAPFLYSLFLSFTDQRLIPNKNIPTEFIGLSNYGNLLTNPEFLRAFFNTFLFVIFVVPIQSALALGAALLVNSRLPRRNFFRGTFFLPTVLTMVVVIVIWTSLFQSPGGFLEQVVRVLTLGYVENVNWLRGSGALAMSSILLVSFWQGFGFQMVIYLAGLQSLNPELYEASRVDGANRWQEFWNVTWPGLRNTNIFVMVTTTVMAFKLFAQVDLMTQGGPLGATQTIVREIYEIAFRHEKNIGLAAAAAVIFFLVVLAISIGQRLFIKEDKEVA
jgi:multiple sugar transport system permease protein